MRVLGPGLEPGEREAREPDADRGDAVLHVVVRRAGLVAGEERRQRLRGLREVDDADDDQRDAEDDGERDEVFPVGGHESSKPIESRSGSAIMAERCSSLLLFDADDSAARGLAERFRATGHAVQTVTALGQAELAARSAHFDAVVFDGLGRWTVGELRRRLPLIPLAAWLVEHSDEGVSSIAGRGLPTRSCTAGWVRRSRPRAWLRSRSAHRGPRPPSFGSLLLVDPERGEATWYGRRLPLTQRERDVLHALAEVGGATLRREVLYRRVWGYAMARGDRAVDVNVKRLRTKLAAEVGAPVAIETEPGVGYRLVVAEAAVTAL